MRRSTYNYKQKSHMVQFFLLCNSYRVGKVLSLDMSLAMSAKGILTISVWQTVDYGWKEQYSHIGAETHQSICLKGEGQLDIVEHADLIAPLREMRKQQFTKTIQWWQPLSKDFRRCQSASFSSLVSYDDMMLCLGKKRDSHFTIHGRDKAATSHF